MADSTTTGSSTTTESTPRQWSRYILEVYMKGKGPEPLGTVVFEEIEEKAKEKLKEYPGAFMYAGGSAGTWTTYYGNTQALNKYRIIPRMLTAANNRDISTTLFGTTHPTPILIAPIGVQGVFWSDGELAPARAARNLGIPFIMSTASTRTIEQVAGANGSGCRWFQLYWPKTNEVTLSILRRAKQSGFTALVITLDTMSIGWRPHDISLSYLPFFHGVGVSVGTSDPVFMGLHGRQPTSGTSSTSGAASGGSGTSGGSGGSEDQDPKFPYDAQAMWESHNSGDTVAREQSYLGTEWLRETNSGLYRSWEDLQFLRDNWDGPLVIKGIQHPEDAEIALDHGVDGIIVSNHGGRQIDGAIPSIYALENIMRSSKVKEAQREGRYTVLFDSGIRTGSDIIKAIAIGAQAVLLGRPWVYGGMIAGQEGIEQVIKHTLADLDITLGQAGYRTLEDIRGKGEGVLMKVDF